MADLKSSLAEATDKVAQTVLSGTEPPSGEKGAGTTDSPFDAGNAPGETLCSVSWLPTPSSEIHLTHGLNSLNRK